MAIRIWKGGAQAIAQVTTITFSAYTAGETYTLTINDKSVSFTATASTNTNVWAGLVAAWGSAADPEIAEVSALENAGVVLTGPVGIPFTVTASATGGITETITATTAATGPNHFDNDDNWIGGTAPGAGDDMIFRDSTYGVLYGLVDTSNNYGDITWEPTMNAPLGLPSQNPLGYREYRPEFLKLGDGSGTFAFACRSIANLIKIDCNAGTINATVYQTGTATGAESALIIKNSDNSSTFDLHGGTIQLDGDTAGSAAAVRITPTGAAQVQGGGALDVLATETFACGAVQQSGGRFECRGACTSIDASNGAQAVFTGTATCPTAKSSSGAQIFWGSTSGITTQIVAFPSGTIDFGSNGAAKTVADAIIHAGGTILDPLGIVAWTDGIELSGCTLQECTIDFGRGKKLDTI